jgi:hypothetical protein
MPLVARLTRLSWVSSAAVQAGAGTAVPSAVRAGPVDVDPRVGLLEVRAL